MNGVQVRRNPVTGSQQGASRSSTLLAGKTVLLDCHWLDIGGAGRATELLLRGLKDVEPEGDWVLWGPDRAADFLWPTARHEPATDHPMSFWGQKSLSRVPRNDVAIYMHQVRPLSPGRSVIFFHDTIPLRFGGSRLRRFAKRCFFFASARFCSQILTVSQFSKMRIERDLRTDGSKIRVIHYPVDLAFVERVTLLRDKLSRRNVALYVGRFARHKNLRRLILAFGQTEFRRGGGRLLLVGGEPDEASSLRDFAAKHSIDRVSIEGYCTQSQLDELYASSRLLVMPSLEEGFGLPVWDAISCGLPVCASDGGALPEITHGVIETFPANSISAMAAAVDATADREPTSSMPLGGRTYQDFALDVLEATAGVAAI